MKFGHLLFLVVVITLAISCTVPAPSPTSTPTPTPVPMPTTSATPTLIPTPPVPSASPAKFDVASLDIKPAEAMLGETISVTAQVKNTGGSEGAYTAVLTLDGKEIETKKITISPQVS